ncbi:MAG: aminotransferase class III-fold pyridoxal phosphate-dependent enzyme, partial [Syntrophales bacterium]
DSVSAFMAEPVVGATAGALVPKDGYFQKIREICDCYDVLLIVDEVMTGIGRTGRNFAIQHWGVAPDMIVCAKGLGAGYYPVFGVITTEAVHAAIKNGNGNFVHGHTYSQNPLACATGIAVLEYIDRHDLVARSAKMGAYLLEKLKFLYRHPIVGDVRGLGLFAGVEFVRNRETKETFAPTLKINALVSNLAFDKGLIVYPGGGGADGIRGDHALIAPPFIITEAQIDQLVAILDEAIAEISKEIDLT